MISVSDKKFYQTIFTISPDLMAKKLPDIDKESKPDSLCRSDFLSAISHELRTPLNAIMGLTDILQEEVRGSESRAECLNYIKDIKQVAMEMDELVHDLLDIGSANSGNFSVNIATKINIADSIKRAVRLNWDYALRRNIYLKFEVADDVSPINLDAKRLKQILTNLISNAAKYSPHNTEVKILASVNRGSLLISVKDQGFGMTAAQVETAFEKYQTISNPNRGSVDSFGLGLPIVKQLTELMNGKIEMKSEVNKGTEVILKFPYLM